jgi:ribosomal protein S18 acetylase RimI-like enzyme
MLEWDSAFWGFSIATVVDYALTRQQMGEIDRWCSANQVRCLYFLARCDDAATLRIAETSGFELVDVRITLAFDVLRDLQSGEDHPSPGVRVRDAQPEDVARLQRISRGTYRDSRFYFDSRFPRGRCDDLYATWVANSCQGYADAVLVAEEAGLALGFITCHLETSDRGRIGLVGVEERARGRGLASALTRAALNWFAERRVPEVLVVTQARNYAAQRVYQRCGAVTQDVALWYHRWFPVGEEA